jgi:soluble lytic murein transglycosylase
MQISSVAEVNTRPVRRAWRLSRRLKRQATGRTASMSLVGISLIAFGISIWAGLTSPAEATVILKHTGPQIPVSEVAVPEVAVPEVAVPEVAVPEVAVPEIPDTPVVNTEQSEPPIVTLSRSDKSTYMAAFKLAKKKKWAAALKMARRGQHPLPRKILRWLEMTRSSGGYSFSEIVDFIKQNPDWPRPNARRSRAEEAIDQTTPEESVLNWFEHQAPLRTEGKVAYGQALIASGQAELGYPHIRDAWIFGRFTRSKEKQFLRRYRKRFSKADHWERLDNLLWNGRRREARRMLPRVTADQRAVATARIRLRRKRGGVDSAISRIPDSLKRDPGFLYERLRWRRRKGRDQEALEILKNPPDTMVRPELWSKERIILARRLLSEGKIDDAYAAISAHGLDNKHKSAFSEAEWLAGWIALRFMSNGKEALERFEGLYRTVVYPVSKARAAYWAGRAAKSIGNAAQANDWFQTAIRYPTTYHGQLATEELGEKIHPSPAPVTPLAAEQKKFDSHELTHAARLLNELDQDRLVRTFLLQHSKLNKSPGHRVMTGRLAHDIGRPDLAIWVARHAHKGGDTLLELGYPLYEMPDGSPERALLLALARQESNFHTKAISRAGARGIMQLMPRTARLVARSNGIRYSRSRLTTDPVYNVRLGRRYLKNMLSKFNGSYILAIAAYNAGPNAVSRWLKKNGDPRSGTNDPIDWIELIPFQETRTYVQRVLGNLQVFRNRLQPGRMAVTLDQDLRRAIPAIVEQTF